MPRSTPRDSRITLVRFTAITASQSASDIRMKSWSRVIPALLTRMSTCPSASAACFGSASTAAASRQVAGQHMRPLAQLPRQRLQRRHPRPRQRHRRALPVQRPRDRAADPARSAGDQRRLARQIEHHPSPASARTSSGVPTAFVSISLAIRRIIPDSALPAPTSTVSVTPLPRHPGHALPPAHPPGHLPHQQLADDPPRRSPARR